ncbi:uncharacterized protein LOC110384650 [Helicoverpa armigera]|uniref:uncharacterized protein LOC110384650 n=1 Tax=Helicoverpa armigera TaxID=29058 RepID=UPI00211141CF|nr:uncharacterized protein LOC110384650 isoform X1 [Helicoverpa armigera]XP_021201725.2 uncharacterized protein LOC110384650 isoform X1 [Helicoverpa armigera]
MDGDKHCYDDDRLYHSDRGSDDSPLLSHRYDKTRRFSPYVVTKYEERERRSTLTMLAKFFLFSTAMILFCVLLYIPVYNKANDQVSKGTVAGWSMHTNRDTKIYVQPNNVTTIHAPKNLCDQKKKLFLLIVVCSSTLNFDRRVAIRESWGNYRTYIEMSKLYHAVKQKYINYNYTYDLYSESDVNNVSSDRLKRDISSFSRLLPELAKALQDNLVNVKTENVPEKRFEDDVMLPQFDMNEDLAEQTEANYDYYDTNVMKIPPKGYEDTPDLYKVLTMLKGNKNFRKMKEKILPEIVDPDYKVVFLLGLPTNDNDSTIQNKIEEESEKYADIIQEGFIDSYNNLTLKSIMMLKWINNNCNNSVRYILKTDDDMYINVPNLIDNLRNRSKKFDAMTQGHNTKEYMLIGDLICGARPVLDSSNKWYSPRYMYGGRVYPKYLSGTGYALSADTAKALYAAALRTNYFHLEDIFITGMCAARAHPRVIPRDDATFSYQSGASLRACGPHARATAHRVSPDQMRALTDMLSKPDLLDMCERMRLTKIKEEHRRIYVFYKFLRLLVSNEC